MLLNHEKFNFLFSKSNYKKIYPIISKSIQSNYIDLIKLLPKDFDFSLFNNLLIEYANEFKNFEIIEFIWRDERVKNSLKNDNMTLYSKLKNIDKIKAF